MVGSSTMKPREVFVSLTNKAQMAKYRFKYHKGSLVKLKPKEKISKTPKIVATDLGNYQRYIQHHSH